MKDSNKLFYYPSLFNCATKEKKSYGTTFCKYFYVKIEKINKAICFKNCEKRKI